MKKTEINQPDTLSERLFNQKLWICNHITNTINQSSGSPAWIRRNSNLRGQTLILIVTANNTYNIRPGFERLFIKFNRRAGQHGDRIPIIYHDDYWTMYKFEGFERYSLFAYAGMLEEYTLDIYEIIISQDEDIEITNINWLDQRT